MSRYYDILKEASRFPDPTGTPKPGPTEVAEEAAIELPEALEALAPEIKVVGPIADPPRTSGSRATGFATPLETEFADILAQSGAPLQEAPARAKTTTTVDRKVPIVAHAQDAAALEHYRRLRTKLVQLNGVKPFRSLLIASAAPQEGKTITTLNLALSYSMLSSFKVLIVDGDLRRGGLGKSLGLDDRPGFQNLIDGSATEETAVFDCSDLGVHVSPRGNSEMSPAELLQSEQLPRLLHRWEEQFDLVILDSCPLNLLTDTQVLSVHCDAILLVARAFATKQKALEKALHDLKPARVLGTILNGHMEKPGYGSYQKYY